VLDQMVCLALHSDSESRYGLILIANPPPPPPLVRFHRVRGLVFIFVLVQMPPPPPVFSRLTLKFPSDVPFHFPICCEWDTSLFHDSAFIAFVLPFSFSAFGRWPRSFIPLLSLSKINPSLSLLLSSGHGRCCNSGWCAFFSWKWTHIEFPP